MATAPSSPAPRRRIATWLGVGFIVLSFALYAAFFGVPFLPFSAPAKVVLAAGVVIAGEISFVVGGLFLGAQVMRRYRRYLNPRNWFRRASAPALTPPAERAGGSNSA
jgi:hypothetical protein